MEIADIFVVNKADREGADRLASAIESNLSLHAYGPEEWRPPIVQDRGDHRRRRAASCGETSAHFASTRRRRRREPAAGARRIPAARAGGATIHGAARSRHPRAPASGRRSSTASRRAKLDPYSGRRTPCSSDAGPLAWPLVAPTDRSATMKAILDHVGIAVADLDGGAGVLSRRARPRGRGVEEVGSQRVRAHFVPVGEATLELLEGDRRRFADRQIRREARPRPASHHAAGRRHRRRAGAAESARRSADRRAAAAGRRRRARRVHSSVRGARRAGRAETGRRALGAADGALAPARESVAPDSRAQRISRYTLGELELISLYDGFFGLDGGAMFGVVPKAAVGGGGAADDRNRIPLAMRPLLVRGVRTMLIDAGRGRQGERQVRRHLRARSRPAPRSRPGGGRPRTARTSTSCWPRICTSITPAASPSATPTGRLRPRFPQSPLRRAARRVGGCHAPARAEPGQLSRRQLRAAGRGRRAVSGRRRSDDHAGRAGRARPAGTPCIIRWSGSNRPVSAPSLSPT